MLRLNKKNNILLLLIALNIFSLSGTSIAQEQHDFININKTNNIIANQYFYIKRDPEKHNHLDRITIPEKNNWPLVGVIDTGVESWHHFLKNNIVDTHIARPNTCDIHIFHQLTCTVSDFGYEHGTPVSQVIVQHNPNVGLLVSRASLPGIGAFFPEQLLESTKWVIENGARVVNYSLGPLYIIPRKPIFTPIFDDRGNILSLYSAIHKNDVLGILAAGNNGTNITQSIMGFSPRTGTIQPNLARESLFDREEIGSFLIVGSITNEGHRQPYSQFPGERFDIQQRFLVATTPAEVYYAADTFTTDHDTEQKIQVTSIYEKKTVYGTSFAAPVVTAAAAKLRGTWEHLTAEDTAQILLRTANRSFSALYSKNNCGMNNDINCGYFYFGMGKVDIQAAMNPIGEIKIPNLIDKNQNFKLTQSRLKLPQGLNINKSNQFLYTGVIDEYNRVFRSNILPLIDTSKQANGIISTTKFNFLNRGQSIEIPSTLSFDNSTFLNTVFSFNSLNGQLLEGGLTLNDTVNNLNLFFKEESTNRALLNPPGIIDFSKFNSISLNHILSNFDSLAQISYRRKLTEHFYLGGKYAIAHINSTHDFVRTAEQYTLFAKYHLNEYFQLALSKQKTHEKGGIHGGYGTGAFQINHSKTNTKEISARIRINDRLSLFGAYKSGTVNAFGNHLINSITIDTAEQFKIGMAAKSDRNKLTLALFQPISSSNSLVTIRNPYRTTAQNNIIFKDTTTTLKNNDPPLNFEINWVNELTNSSFLKFNFTSDLNQTNSLNNYFFGVKYHLFW